MYQELHKAWNTHQMQTMCAQSEHPCRCFTQPPAISPNSSQCSSFVSWQNHYAVSEYCTVMCVKHYRAFPPSQTSLETLRPLSHQWTDWVCMSVFHADLIRQPIVLYGAVDVKNRQMGICLPSVWQIGWKWIHSPFPSD